MKRVSVLFSSLIALVLMAGIGQAQVDPQLGVWTLDVDRSSFSPGPAPRSQTAIYTQIGRGVRVVGQGMSGAGKAINTEFSYSFDGREHPARGFADWNSVKARQVNARTIEYTRYLKGEEVQVATRTISADGKTATVRVKGVDAADNKVDNTLIFTRK